MTPIQFAEETLLTFIGSHDTQGVGDYFAFERLKKETLKRFSGKENKEIRKVVEKFLNDLIPEPSEDVLSNPEIADKIKIGKVQMRSFLKKANLGSPLLL